MAKLNMRRDPPAFQEVRKTLSEPEPAAPASVPSAAHPTSTLKSLGGRPKGPIARDRQLATKLQAKTYDDMKRISERDRISLAELIERAIARYEEHRVAKAKDITERRAGESENEFVRRAFRLGEW